MATSAQLSTRDPRKKLNIPRMTFSCEDTITKWKRVRIYRTNWNAIRLPSLLPICDRSALLMVAFQRSFLASTLLGFYLLRVTRLLRAPLLGFSVAHSRSSEIFPISSSSATSLVYALHSCCYNLSAESLPPLSAAVPNS